MTSKVNSKVNSRWKAFDTQLLDSIRVTVSARAALRPLKFHSDDWLDSLKYGLLFGTPDEVFRVQGQAMIEAEKEGRPYTPVFWTASEAGAEPVLTLWRIE